MSSDVQGMNSDGVPYSMHVTLVDPTRYATPGGNDGMTRQEFKDECDINVLMATYEKHGTLPPLSDGSPRYMDVSEVPSFMEAMEVYRKAGEAFMTLPAKVRAEFDHDPEKFAMFAMDEANKDQMREWGLLKPLPEPAQPVEVRIVNPEPSEPPAAK